MLTPTSDSYDRQHTLARDLNQRFGVTGAPRFFSAPGRVELGGNHTDHQGGQVLCAAVDRDILAAAAPLPDRQIRLYSTGYRDTVAIDLNHLEPHPGETGHSAAMIRGIAAWLNEHGHRVGGFAACTDSTVPRGSGLSSSAAFELLVAQLFNHLYNGGTLPPEQLAAAAQFAENHYYGKPCGLMDQMASALGGVLRIAFPDPEQPDVHRVADHWPEGFPDLVVTHTGGSHAALGDAYAAIPADMLQVARRFRADRLCAVDEQEFREGIPRLRGAVSDRALLRAMHYFDETRRAGAMADALAAGDRDTFCRLTTASGRSSWMLLQNVIAPGGDTGQELATALAWSASLLGSGGAVRVHGGGFAGSILALVPPERTDAYLAAMRSGFPDGDAQVLRIRAAGAGEVAAS